MDTLVAFLSRIWDVISDITSIYEFLGGLAVFVVPIWSRFSDKIFPKGYGALFAGGIITTGLALLLVGHTGLLVELLPFDPKLTWLVALISSFICFLFYFFEVRSRRNLVFGGQTDRFKDITFPFVQIVGAVGLLVYCFSTIHLIQNRDIYCGKVVPHADVRQAHPELPKSLSGATITFYLKSRASVSSRSRIAGRFCRVFPQATGTPTKVQALTQMSSLDIEWTDRSTVLGLVVDQPKPGFYTFELIKFEN